MVHASYIDGSAEDQRKPNRLQPDRPVSEKELNALGVQSYILDAENYETDPELAEIRRLKHYNWMDIVTVHKDTLPNYEEKLKIFFEEHLHVDDEVRLILEGSGYFDIRDKEDRWIRLFLQKGDLITLPAGIYHRFTLDENMMQCVFNTLHHIFCLATSVGHQKNYIKAMRLFAEDPNSIPYNRPAEDNEARTKYLQLLQQKA